jgi:hypothetical protein
VPATVTVAVRAAPGLAAKVSVAVVAPLPEAGLAIQSGRPATVQMQAGHVVTAMGAEPPAPEISTVVRLSD